MLRIQARQHIARGAPLVGAADGPDCAHHLPGLGWFATGCAEHLLGVDSVFRQVRSEPVQPEANVD
jgi:hypothetical protein